MHTIIPVLVGIRGHINLFLFIIWVAQVAVNRHVVLQAVGTQHGGAFQVFADNLFADFRCGILRGISFALEHLVVEKLRLFSVLVPPQSEGRHVVGGNGAYREVRVLLQVVKSHAEFLGHALYFQRQYLQPFQHALHRARHHSEVFRAWQHGIHDFVAARHHDFLHFLERLLRPKLVVAPVEKILIEAVERLSAMVVKRLERTRFMPHNARVIAPSVRILDKEHLCRNLHQGFL